MADKPPPPVKVSARISKGFQKLAADTEKMNAIRENAEASRYFDGSAPSTRKYWPPKVLFSPTHSVTTQGKSAFASHDAC
jgi:hypothetical protein